MTLMYLIHIYLDAPLVPRTANRTCLISDSGHDELIRMIQTNLETEKAHEKHPCAFQERPYEQLGVAGGVKLSVNNPSSSFTLSANLSG